MKDAMLNLIGPVKDNFAILASPADADTYRVVIFPEVAPSLQEVAVPAEKLKHFAEIHRATVEPGEQPGNPDVFIHSLTAEEVRELTSGEVSAQPDAAAGHNG